MTLVSVARWLGYSLFPVTCPECGRLLTPVVRRTPEALGVVLPVRDPRLQMVSDWLVCEACPYVAAFDLAAEEA